MNKQTILAILTVSTFSTITILPAKALTFDYSFTTDAGNAYGTLTTDGSEPVQANFTYNITAISGNFCSPLGLCQLITRLNTTYQGPENTLRWDGTAFSPLIVSTGGLSFETADGAYNISSLGPNKYGAAKNLIDPNLDSYSFVVSKLNPNTTAVAEPSTFLGTAVGLGSIFIFKARSRK